MLTGTELFSLSWLFNGSTVNIFNITFKICYIENLRSDWYYHSHKKRKDEITAVLLICELKIYGVVLHRIHQNSKKWWLLWGITQLKWLWDCFSHFLLLWLCCQRFRDSSEDHYRSKDYHKCYSCVIVFWISKIYQSTTVKKGWLLTS